MKLHYEDDTLRLDLTTVGPLKTDSPNAAVIKSADLVEFTLSGEGAISRHFFDGILQGFGMVGNVFARSLQAAPAQGLGTTLPASFAEASETLLTAAYYGATKAEITALIEELVDIRDNDPGDQDTSNGDIDGLED